ncbi:hypothetical protein STEG23_013900 [Scotinomys teguina]
MPSAASNLHHTLWCYENRPSERILPGQQQLDLTTSCDQSQKYNFNGPFAGWGGGFAMSDDDSRASTSSSSSSSSNQQTEKEASTPKKKESKVSMSKNSKLLSTSAKRIQKELADITLDPPPNCRAEDRTQGLALARQALYH